MKKFAILSIFFFCAILIAGVYGILHDQITFTISPEYFTKFKYGQIGMDPSWFGGNRQTVAIIGFLATWWTGLIAGVVLGLTSLILPNHKTMASTLRRALALMLTSSILCALVGSIYGLFYTAIKSSDWWVPDLVADKKAFILVASIHDFSYLGGLLGLILGTVYIFRRKRSLNLQVVGPTS